MTKPRFRAGVVEGFYGRPWSWDERASTAEFMRLSGFYEFYLYCPKGDSFLRRRWREPWPAETATALRALVSRFHELGLTFGVGLSPHEFSSESFEVAEGTLLRKIDEIVSLGVGHVALLFDDMRGDLPGLAALQIKAAQAVARRCSGMPLSLCPSYYSDDPVLDRLFGQRPADYLEELGRELPLDVEIFWTGEQICSRSYTAEHLRKVGALLRRKPLLWDNYPVNDTERMCKFLHLGPFTGRPAVMRELLSGHLVNPMLQCHLSRIPMLTLPESYRLAERYDSERAFLNAAEAVAGSECPELVPLLVRDRARFHEQGLDAIEADPRLHRQLVGEYSAISSKHPAAREVTAWLESKYRVSKAVVESQLG